MRETREERKERRDDFNKAVGARIRAVREARGIKQYWLAEHALLTKQGLYYIESGKAGAGLAVLAAIARLLDVRSDYLLGLEIGHTPFTTEGQHDRYV